jgi:hypothetical protein
MKQMLLVVLMAFASLGAGAQSEGPSRAPVKGCQWEKLSHSKVGLALWAQRCDFGFRKIKPLFEGGSFAIQYSDGGGPQKLIDVIGQRPNETPQATLTRFFSEHTAADLRARCVLTEYRDNRPTPAGKQRYTFVPDAAYQKDLAVKTDPNEVPEPACGEWGEQPDGVQYFEVSTNTRARKLLFVRIGQDAPLFDEQTLQLIEPTSGDAATGEVPCCDYRPGPGGITADFLLETCSVTGQTAHGMIPYFDCQSYVLAVLDTYRSMRNTGGNRCLPAELTAREVLEVMTARFKWERDGHRRASDVIVQALHSKFPCMKATK